MFIFLYRFVFGFLFPVVFFLYEIHLIVLCFLFSMFFLVCFQSFPSQVFHRFSYFFLKCSKVCQTKTCFFPPPRAAPSFTATDSTSSSFALPKFAERLEFGTRKTSFGFPTNLPSTTLRNRVMLFIHFLNYITIGFLHIFLNIFFIFDTLFMFQFFNEGVNLDHLSLLIVL